MRKSNNYFKFLEYVTYGKDHDDTIDKGNGVLECKSYVSMCNVECGLWTSANEESTGYHKSRRYNQLTIRY